MSLNVNKVKGGSSKAQVQQPVMEPGTYPVRVVQIVDLGIQEQRPFKGEPKPPRHTLHLTYEFVDEFLLDEEGNEQEDKPRWLSEEFPLYNLKSDRATSSKRYKALDPTEEHEGDFSRLLGSPANALVTTYVVKRGPNEGKERNAVQDLSAMRPRDAAKTPDLVNEPKIFVLDDPDLEVFLSLPEWLQEKIKGNLEYEGSPLQQLLSDGKAKEEPEEKEDPEEVAEESPEDAFGDEAPW